MSRRRKAYQTLHYELTANKKLNGESTENKGMRRTLPVVIACLAVSMEIVVVEQPMYTYSVHV